MYTGLTHPNYGEMGMESSVPTGTGAALPYGQSVPGGSAGTVSTSSQVGNQDSAVTNIGYSRYTPMAGRADRLAANTGPFMGGSYYNGRGSNV